MANCLLIRLSCTLKLHIVSSSNTQRLQDFGTCLYSEDNENIGHLLGKALSWSFAPHTYFDSSMSFWLERFLDKYVWLLYIVLNSVSDIPK